ncbi:MAG: 16S rRNA (guanine(527)-N(7))-methyltransferase RsmG [Bacilli bacterium]|nr:16S rRNA (guanine(527)-N(7))-methyltransferase RsmG [Bacilli bacterium]MDD4406612.1 16S rRNA (guanine(527)-N(7))-methyltransferase RsmG [Bacilli bacterium]
MNKKEFILELSKLNIKVTNKELEKLEIYYKFLKEYNSHTNLTSIIEKDLVYLKHFYDSLTINKALDLYKHETLLDIGTGAGFPGMVIKIFYPHLKITLLDSNNKKIMFLKQLAEKLDLKDNLYIINARSEDYIKEKRDYFDIVTSRGVADLKILLELSLPFAKLEGYVVPLKGNIKEELESSKKVIDLLGGKLLKVINFKLPFENSNRNIPIIKKKCLTSPKYPRSYNLIIKKHLNLKVNAILDKS